MILYRTYPSSRATTSRSKFQYSLVAQDISVCRCKELSSHLLSQILTGVTAFDLIRRSLMSLQFSILQQSLEVKVFEDRREIQHLAGLISAFLVEINMIF
jgi:hypothetical protein